MGKRGRRNKNTSSSNIAAAGTNSTATTTGTPLSSSATTTNAASLTYYPSDGPSDVELLQTTSQSLQNKLNQLTELGLANDRASFVQEFVPLDLSPQDTQAYLEDLTIHPEAEGQWKNLIAEIAAMRSGKGVDRIEGDQLTRAHFFFQHPLLEKCDREVSFVCNGVNGGEWRADG